MCIFIFLKSLRNDKFQVNKYGMAYFKDFSNPYSTGTGLLNPNKLAMAQNFKAFLFFHSIITVEQSYTNGKLPTGIYHRWARTGA
jgi:hypothetical protein